MRVHHVELQSSRDCSAAIMDEEKKTSSECFCSVTSRAQRVRFVLHDADDERGDERVLSRRVNETKRDTPLGTVFHFEIFYVMHIGHFALF